tara:strand:+ start:1066 stop:1413 length:348 start_codon:yes stop_codon:yes gene_type:complete
MNFDNDFISNLLPYFNCCFYHLTNLKLTSKKIYNLIIINEKYKDILITLLKNDIILYKNKYELYADRFKNIIEDIAYIHYDNQYLVDDESADGVSMMSVSNSSIEFETDDELDID